MLEEWKVEAADVQMKGEYTNSGMSRKTSRFTGLDFRGSLSAERQARKITKIEDFLLFGK